MGKYQITCEELTQVVELIKLGKYRYALDELSEDSFFYQAFTKYPNNDTLEIIAMKIALVDTIYSTNLGRILGNKEYNIAGKHIVREVFTFRDLVLKIANSNFDSRVEKGDISLVSELTKWSKSHGANIMSFFSKYCLCHNYISYGKDDYSIFDSVVKNSLGKYISEEEFRQLFPEHTVKGIASPSAITKALSLEIGKMKNNCDYESFHKLIGKILRLKKVPEMRRNLDYLIWYNNRLEN